MLTASLFSIAVRCATVSVEDNLITIKHNRWTACEFENFIDYGTVSIFDEISTELWEPHMRHYRSNFLLEREVEWE